MDNALQCLVPDRLWHAQQALSFGPLAISSRMTVVRLRDGGLWVHSPIAPSPVLSGALQALGPVRYVVAPNRSHHLYFADFLAAFPDAQGYLAPGLEHKRPDLAQWPRLRGDEPWTAELRPFFIAGLPVLNETVWFDEGSGSLILTDLLFCFSTRHRGLTALAARLLGVRGRLAMSRTMKLLVKDRRLLAQSVEPLLQLPVQRIILAHDTIIDTEPAAQMSKAFAWLQSATDRSDRPA